jgi:FAD/FMN-containing dehydrogenase
MVKAMSDMSFPPDSYSGMDPKLKEWVDDVENPSYNIPSKVLFPTVANDVVAAVQFAKRYGLQISVKNSGHSYIGASSKKDTLLINMNKFKQYVLNIAYITLRL